MRPENKKQKRGRAFTLVELLVVVSIIIILVAILVPSLEKAIAVSQAAKCAANLHGLGRATALFANDKNRQIPSCETFGVNRSPYGYDDGQHSWHADTNGVSGIKPEGMYPGAQLWPYAASEEIFMCPVFLGGTGHPKATEHFNASAHNGNERRPTLAYVMHESMRSGGWFDLSLTTISGPWVQLSGTQSSAPLNPQSTLIYSEEDIAGNAYAAVGRNNPNLGINRYRNPADRTDAIGSLHPNNGRGDPKLGTANVAFLDGHVDRHSPSESKELAFPDLLW